MKSAARNVVVILFLPSVELSHSLEALYLLLNSLQFACEWPDRGVDSNVGIDELLEVLQGHALGLGGVVVLLFDELHLGLVGSVYLFQLAVLFVFEYVHLASFFHSLQSLVDVLLLRIIDRRDLLDLLVLDLVLGSRVLHERLASGERFFELDELSEELVMLLFLFPELLVEVFVQLLLRLLLLDEFLDLRIPVSLKLGDQPFLVCLLLCLELLLKVLVGFICLFLLLVKFLLSGLQLLTSIIELLDLNVEVSMLHMHLFDLFSELGCIVNESLKLSHGHVFGVRLLSILLDLFEFVRLVVSELLNLLLVAVVPMLIELIELLAPLQDHCLLVAFILLLANCLIVV